MFEAYEHAQGYLRIEFAEGTWRESGTLFVTPEDCARILALGDCPEAAPLREYQPRPGASHWTASDLTRLLGEARAAAAARIVTLPDDLDYLAPDALEQQARIDAQRLERLHVWHLLGAVAARRAVELGAQMDAPWTPDRQYAAEAA